MLYEFLRDQGSLIAGVLALIAGFLAYRAGVAQAKATMAAADREIAANKEAISAAQEQTRVAQGQIAVTLRLERRRAAQETCGFLATLEAAMGTVLEDIEASREIFANQAEGGSSPMAYRARQRIKKTAFEDLRSGCIRLGQLIVPSSVSTIRLMFSPRIGAMRRIRRGMKYGKARTPGFSMSFATSRACGVTWRPGG